MNRPNPTRTRNIVLFAILAAILILMAFTPLGYLSIGVVSITFLMIPVIIGAATLGPLGGLGLGFVFAVTSFIGCFGINAFTTLLFSINPWLTALNLFFPRLLFGFLAGVLYKLFKKSIKVPVVPEALTMVLSAIIHTSVFVVLFYVSFSHDPAFEKYSGGFFAVIWAMFGVNAVVEWAVCGVVGTAILKTLTYFITRYDRKKAAKAEADESQETADDDDDFEQFTAPVDSETPADNQSVNESETQEEHEEIPLE